MPKIGLAGQNRPRPRLGRFCVGLGRFCRPRKVLPSITPKIVKKSKKNRFLDSARNAPKWHPIGLNRSQNTFLWALAPFCPILVGSPLSFWARGAILGSKTGPKGPQNGPKWPKIPQNSQKVEKFSIFRFCSKWSKTVSKHIFMAF